MKKLEELIHNSQDHQNITHASVSIRFALAADTVLLFVSLFYLAFSFNQDDPNRVMIDDQSIFTVSRTVDRRMKGNTSVYRINGHECPFKTVADTLKRYGFDVKNNRFMILQGEVKSISMMKPKGDKDNDGLLEYIEDIIGTNYLIEPIEQSEKRLDELVEERQHKIFTVRTVEAEKNALEAPKAEAEMYIQQERNVMMLKWKRAMYKLSLEKQKQRKIEEERTEKQTELNTINKDMKDKAKSMSEKTKQLERNKRTLERKNDEIQAHESELKHAEERDKQLEKQMKEADKKLKEAENEFKKTKMTIEKSSELARQAAEDYAAEEVGLIAHQEELHSLEQQRHEIGLEIAAQTEEPRRALDAVKQRQAVPERKLKEIRRRTEELNDETTTRQHQKERLQAALADVRRLQEEERNLREEDARYADALQKLRDRQRILGESEAESRRAREAATARERKAQSDVQRLRETVQNLEFQLSQARSGDRSTAVLMQEAEAGRIIGLYGRLETLGWIDEQYEAALIAAAGGSGENTGRLRSFVVETADAAEQCVRVLKERGLGIESFMILEKLRPQMAPFMDATKREWERTLQVSGLYEQYLASQSKRGNGPPDHTIESSPLSSFRQAPLLAYLIVPQRPEFFPAFFHLVRNTLVSPTLDAATQLAFEGGSRRKVVTVDGDVIEASGAMSGGARAPAGARGAAPTRRNSRHFTDGNSEIVFGIVKSRRDDGSNEDALRAELTRATDSLRRAEAEWNDARRDYDNLIARLRQGAIPGSPHKEVTVVILPEDKYDPYADMPADQVDMQIKKINMNKEVCVRDCFF